MTERMCSVDGCDRTASARGWCQKHYLRWKSHDDPLYVAPVVPKAQCSVDGCEANASSRGWCRVHYARWQRHNDPTVLVVRSPRAECPVVDGNEPCGRPVRVDGLCFKHYQRKHKWGDPATYEGTLRGSPMAWLIDAVANRDRTTGCWVDWPFSVKGKEQPYPTINGRTASHIVMELDGRFRPTGAWIDMCHSVACISKRCLNPDHLRWDTRSENQLDKYRAGWVHPNQPKGETFVRSKLTEAAVRAIRAECAAGASQTAVARKYGVSQSNVSQVVRRVSWTHVA